MNTTAQTNPGDAKPAAGPSKFRVTTPASAKPPVDPKALEQFAAQADQVGAPKGPEKTAAVASDTQPALVDNDAAFSDRTKGFLLRLLPGQFDRVEEVFNHSTFKSKQKFGETLFLKAVEDLAKELGI